MNLNQDHESGYLKERALKQVDIEPPPQSHNELITSPVSREAKLRAVMVIRCVCSVKMCHFSPLISSQRELSWKRAAFRCALQSGVGVRKSAEASGTKIIMFLFFFFVPWKQPEHVVLKGWRAEHVIPTENWGGVVTHFLPVTAALTCPTSPTVRGCLRKPALSVSWPPAHPRHPHHVTQV